MMNWPRQPGVAERISQKRRGVAVLISSARMLNGLVVFGKWEALDVGMPWWDYGIIDFEAAPDEDSLPWIGLDLSAAEPSKSLDRDLWFEHRVN